MRKLVYFVAATIDGFIAGPDGNFDMFLFEGPHVADLHADFPETNPTVLRGPLGLGPNRRFDTVLMGRSTYEVGLKQGVASPYSHLEQYVISSKLAAAPDPAVRVVADDPLALVRTLKRASGQDIWLCGGGKLASSLIDEIDELVIKRHPVVMGAGIPIFSGAFRPLQLRLSEERRYDNGFLRLHYTRA
jgi:dihydrofolate reductase